MNQILAETERIAQMSELPNKSQHKTIDREKYIFEYTLSKSCIKLSVNLKVYGNITKPLMELKECQSGLQMTYDPHILDHRDTFRGSVALNTADRLEAVKLFCLEIEKYFDY